MARPRLDEQERRARTVGVRVTAAEEAELRERAQAARLSIGAYLRRRALGQRVRSAAELRLGAAELRELNRIGVNLNQMARALNSRAVSSPAETQAAVERVGELVAKLLAGERSDGGQDVLAGALVRWRGGLLPARSSDAGGGPPSRERGAGGVDRDPQPGDERGRAGGPDHGSHGGGVPGVETPGGGGGDGAQAGEAGVPLFAELGQG